MELYEKLGLTISIISILAIVLIITILLIRTFKYKYKGTNTTYMAILFIPLYLFTVYFSSFDASGDGGNAWENWLSAITDTISCFVLGLNFEAAMDFFNASPLLAFVAVMYIVLGIIGLIFTMIGVIKLFFKGFKTKIKNTIFSLFTNKRKIIIFTDSNSLEFSNIASSMKSERIIVVIGEDESKEFKDSLALEGYEVKVANVNECFLTKYLKKPSGFTKRSNKKVLIFSLFSSNTQNTEFAFYANETIKKYYGEMFNKLAIYAENEASNYGLLIEERKEVISKIESKKLFNQLTHHTVYIYTDDKSFEETYQFYKNSYGMIRTISKENWIAEDFVMNNPISNLIDLKKDDKDLHIHFLGFNKISKKIFCSILPSYQTGDDKIIHYHIFAENSIDVVKEYESIYSTKTAYNSEYLDIPNLYTIDSILGNSDYKNEVNINEYIKECKNKSVFKNAKNIFIISSEDEVKNSEISVLLHNKLIKIIGEKVDGLIYSYISSDDYLPELRTENDNHLVIFNNRNYDFTSDYFFPIIVFGRNSDIYTFDRLNEKNIMNVAKIAAKSYDYNYAANISMVFEKNYDSLLSQISWANTTGKNRESNISCCLQIKAKLDYIGYSLTDDLEIVDKENKKIDAKNISDLLLEEKYSNYICKMEHNRWLLSNYLIFGYNPMTKAEFIDLNVANKKAKLITKNALLTKHIDMCSNNGLIELGKFIEENKKAFLPNFNNDEKRLKEIVLMNIKNSDVDFLKRLPFMIDTSKKEN